MYMYLSFLMAMRKQVHFSIPCWAGVARGLVLQEKGPVVETVDPPRMPSDNR